MIGGLSMTELIIILGLALLLLGPDQLPHIAKSLGKGLRELRKATDDIKSQFEQEMVNVEEPPRRMLAPVPSPSDDPAAARAGARTAATSVPDDPAAARAAARRAATAPAPAANQESEAPAIAAAPASAASAASAPAAASAAPEGTVPARDGKA
jgi:TatA/E family protein of Tat protein translocase